MQRYFTLRAYRAFRRPRKSAHMNWQQDRDYQAGMAVFKGDKIYRANGDIAPGTDFAEGTEGPTWRRLL